MADYQSTHSGLTIDTRVSQVATNTADIAALKARMNQAESDLDAKADATSVAAVNSRVGGVEAKIPSSATTSNKLVDKAYLDNALAGKVDVNGSKGLSTNDFTNAYKTKLDGLPTGLEISNALDGKASTSSVSDVSSRVTAVEGKIPSAATSSNQLADKAFVNNGLSGKQATLQSGTNIKTINGESILGSGNIVAGDPNAVKYVSQSLTESQKAQARTNIGAASAGELTALDGQVSQLENKVTVRLPSVTEEGFFVADSEENVALKYTSDGFDVAKLSHHLLGLMQIVFVNEAGYFFVDDELRIGAKIDGSGLQAKTTLNYVIE